MRGTDAVIASAESVRDFYIEQVDADPDKVEVIYNAVDWSQLETTMTRDEFRAAIRRPAGRAGGRHHRPADRAEGASRPVRRHGAARRRCGRCTWWWSATASCASRCKQRVATLGLAAARALRRRAPRSRQHPRAPSTCS